MPPILRESVIARKPSDEGHVVVYQSNSVYTGLVDFLKKGTQRTCYVYGYSRTEGRDGNVIFMKKDENGFLDKLASCSYVIQGGSHTLMTEALYLGKPVLTLPLKAMVEQRYNAMYIESLGYGIEADMYSLTPEILHGFEARLDEFRANISRGSFCGNEIVFGLVDAFIRTGHLPETGTPPVMEPPAGTPNSEK